MPLDPVIRQFLEHLHAIPTPPLTTVTAQEYRQRQAMSLVPGMPVAEVRNFHIELPDRALAVRMYRPADLRAPYPALVFYHGGGWVLGGLESHDPVCRAVANIAHCVVLSVDYRLAPEYKFPTAVADAYDTLVWIADHAESLQLDQARIAVGGDSAGGNLAAVACILAKERKGPKIAYQWLLYPSTGYDPENPPASMDENGVGYLLTLELMTWFRNHYLNSEADLVNPYFAPVLYSDLSDLPPAYIATAQYDPLRDVGKMYADALRESGVPVTYHNFDDLIHGFAQFHGVSPSATQALELCAQVLRDALHQGDRVSWHG